MYRNQLFPNSLNGLAPRVALNNKVYSHCKFGFLENGNDSQ